MLLNLDKEFLIGMVVYMKKPKIVDLVIIGGLIVTQFIYAGNSVLMGYIMSLGINPLTIVIFTSFATFLITSPFAICFERSKWPREFSMKLLIELVLIALGGVTLFQSFLLKGIKLTSPALATAMPNLAPGLIFVIAWTLRLEKVKLSCKYSKVKIGGTLLCVVGAITMSLMNSTTSTRSSEAASLSDLNQISPNLSFDKQKIIGCIYLMAAVLALSINIVLQAKALEYFPAPMSMCAVTSLIGVIITSLVQFFQDYDREFDSAPISLWNLLSYSFLGGGVGGALISFNGWAMKKKGPVFVSMFNPIATVISIVLSVVTLGDTIKIGSIAGMVIIVAGLYMVLWAKGKESYSDGDYIDNEDAKKPLLS